MSAETPTTDQGHSTKRLTYTIDEAANLLGVGRNQAYSQAKTGALAGAPVIKVGKRFLIPRVALGPDKRLMSGGQIPRVRRTCGRIPGNHPQDVRRKTLLKGRG